jgi:DNA/RNA endonuclease YhcR with UshA esterase domain
MRMQKEEKIVFVLLLMALGSLVVAFWAFSSDDGEVGSFDDSETNEESDGIGSLTSVEGVIVVMRTTKSGGNLLISLDSTTMPIFISRNAGAEELSDMLKEGDRISAKGMEKEYQGQKEIEVNRYFDVRVLN